MWAIYVNQQDFSGESHNWIVSIYDSKDYAKQILKEINARYEPHNCYYPEFYVERYDLPTINASASMILKDLDLIDDSNCRPNSEVGDDFKEMLAIIDYTKYRSYKNDVGDLSV